MSPTLPSKHTSDDSLNPFFHMASLEIPPWSHTPKHGGNIYNLVIFVFEHLDTATWYFSARRSRLQVARLYYTTIPMTQCGAGALSCHE